MIELEHLEAQVLKRLALLAEGGTSTLDPIAQGLADDIDAFLAARPTVPEGDPDGA